MPSRRRAADPGVDSEQSERGPAKKRGPRLLKVALLGGTVALLINDDLRNQLLNTLFGAEEEFDYSSLTEPAPPGSLATNGAQPELGAPWVRPVADEPADSGEPADAQDSADAEDPPPAAEPPGWTPRAVAPSPTAWGDQPQPPTAVPDPPRTDVTAQAATPAPRAAATPQAVTPPPVAPAAPPPVPRDWWAPLNPAAGDH